MAKEIEPPGPRKWTVSNPAAMMHATNIDRRTCQRVVPMKVLALGVSRTGTSSMRQALVDLGYDDCYHYGSVLNENPRDAEMWVEALEAKFEGKGKFGKGDWDQLLGHCMAVTDTPCATFYKELLSTYPDAKVILTVRDSAQQWWQSQMNTIIPYAVHFIAKPETWSLWLYRKFMPPPPIAFDRMNQLVFKHYGLFHLLMKDLRDGTTTGMQWYDDYCDEIRRIVPADKLLVMNVKEGWEPLCKFLDKDVPAWKFPKVNSVDDWEVNMISLNRIMDAGVYLNVAKTLAPIVVGAVAMGSYWYFQAR